MIKLSRLNGQTLWLNAELIESIEMTPDSLITLVGGKTMMVRENVDTVIKRIIRYRRRIHSLPVVRDTKC